MQDKINIFWFRRDLRLSDNAGLYYALKAHLPVLPIFIFDTIILQLLNDKEDARVDFIHHCVRDLQDNLLQLNSSIKVFHDSPKAAFEQLIRDYNVHTVFTNADYEPYATQRDAEVSNLLREKNIGFITYKDQVIFEKDEVIKDDGTPYTVFTAYSKKWKANLNEFYLKSYPTEKYSKRFFKTAPMELVSLENLGFKKSKQNFPPKKVASELVKEYGQKRDFPGLEGTSRLGIHFRFGTISISKAMARAQQLSPVFMNELIWRDFYHMILWHFPQVGKGRAFKPAYENIEWRNDNGEFEKWCEGKTGYPIVDAGMRQLNETGFMHNRVRMVVASFLCKHLLLDWRLGEAYFAEKLLDYDLAANNGGWQWAAGSGCDAAPYFRIFNPYLQTKKFDPNLNYIRQWVPEFESVDYPKPIVEHEFARDRCLKVYKEALKKEMPTVRINHPSEK